MTTTFSIASPSLQHIKKVGLALILTTAASWAIAQGPGPAGKGPMTPEAMQKIHEMRVERLAKRISATPEQKQKLLQIQQRDNGKLIALQSQMRELRKREAELLRADKIDRDGMQQILRERQTLQMQQQAIREKQRLDGVELLTPQQRAKLGAHDNSMIGQPGKKSMKDSPDAAMLAGKIQGPYEQAKPTAMPHDLHNAAMSAGSVKLDAAAPSTPVLQKGSSLKNTLAP